MHCGSPVLQCLLQIAYKLGVLNQRAQILMKSTSMSIRFLVPTLLMMAISLSGDALADTANPFPALWKAHPFYFGPLLGYGSTDWSMLVLNCSSSDEYCDPSELSLSTPLAAGDNGWVWGATIGYEVKPFWAVESSFMRFPNTTVQFDSDSFYKSIYNLSTFRTTSWALMTVAKFMTQIAQTGFRGFANAGIDFTFRNDVLNTAMRVNPTFGVGINYVFEKNIMFELGFQYVPGYGQANEIPAASYMPFLYAVTAKLFYRV